MSSYIHYPIWLVSIISIAVIASSGCAPTFQETDKESTESFVLERPSKDMSPDEANVLRINVNEEIVLHLQSVLKTIESKIKNEDCTFSNLLCKSVRYSGPKGPLDLDCVLPSEITGLEVEISDLTEFSAEELGQAFWQPVLSAIEFEDTQFGTVSGVLSPRIDEFVMKVVFEGRGRAVEGSLVSVFAKQKIAFRLIDQEWKICSWEQLEFDLRLSKKPLFFNVTRDVIADNRTLSLAMDSRHEQLLLQRAEDPALLTNHDPVFQTFTDWNSLFQYPGVSIVDFNNDGWDDLFLTNRFASNCLLKNVGDGTFVDATKEAGLFLEQGMSNCSLFADFDNDGDQDLLLCRTFQPALFYRNQDGKYRLDAAVNRKFTYVRFVSAGSVADVNGDGLLDVYLSTYVTKSGSDFRWIEYATHPNLQPRLFEEITNSHSFLDRKGPPNFLLLNKGGNLEPAPTSAPLDAWRNSYQSVWFDYDRDGDSDLYVCNDFAPDVLLRNDTVANSFDPTFVDVTEEAFEGNSMGFGMGASVGDFDNDADLDLYVSNMYSKAGRRIVQQLGRNVDPRIAVSSQGNFLYENDDGRFGNVAGLDQGHQHVAKVGWSFGGQFADFNNDSFLDVFVPSGFFTAPRTIADEVDL